MGLSKELKQADLNLLVTLHLLMKYRSVKLVAEEMCLSQSAVSRALGRLRETFSDPLFIRHHAGLEPTDKARMIEVQLSSIINEVDDLLADSPFDLASCNEDFVISAPSLIGCYLIPSLVVQLIKFAPKCSLQEVQSVSYPSRLLEDGTVDFVLHNVPIIDKNYYCQHLGKLHINLFVRESHPLANRQNLNIQDLKPFPILGNLVERTKNSSYESPITTLCEKIGGRSKPILRSVQLHSLFETVNQTDSILLATSTLRKDTLSGFSLKVLEVDQALIPPMDMYLVALKSKLKNPSYDWLKEQIIENVKNICS
ncbi:LysR family transcriptional regulator [Vibrio breoganii]|uniref:LysR substrate-binding domain-containing protein n=1 Tax=Vibrio breoganii TaxID=553239 RepID=UPI000C81832D|nr:LysR family transcriptional regulator [Vibrio breoganii]PML21614.1 hypothetical protein BCT82_17085 [Vibrio breoganii]